MRKKTKKPFKIIADAVGMRERLHELTGNELKVWMYLWLRTAEGLTAFPGNKTIASELDINPDTVKDAKRGLRSKGWTSREHQRTRDNGTFSTVEEKVHLPWAKKASTEEEKSTHGTVVEKTVDGKFHQQKEYSVSLEVTPLAYSGENLEVHSESASELVSESRASDLQKQSCLCEQARTILGYIYPVKTPDNLSADWDRFNTIALEFRAHGIDIADFFTWNRTHKPAPLHFRKIDKFIEGAEYAMNDYGTHYQTKDTCKVCALKAKAAAVSAPSGEWEGDTRPKKNPNPNCAHCKGSTYGNPTYEEGKPYCGNCMKVPHYRRHSGERDILGGKGDIFGDIGKAEAAVATFDPEEA